MTRILLQLLQHSLDHIAHDWLTLPRPLLLGSVVLLSLAFLGGIVLLLLLSFLCNSGSLFALLLGLATNVCHGINLLSSFLVLLGCSSVPTSSFFIVRTGFAIVGRSSSSSISLTLIIITFAILIIAISLPAGTSPSLVSLLLHSLLVLSQSRCLVRETLFLPFPVATQRLGLRRGRTGVDQWAGARGSATAWFLVGRHLSLFFFCLGAKAKNDWKETFSLVGTGRVSRLYLKGPGGICQKKREEGTHARRRSTQQPFWIVWIVWRGREAQRQFIVVIVAEGEFRPPPR